MDDKYVECVERAIREALLDQAYVGDEGDVADDLTVVDGWVDLTLVARAAIAAYIAALAEDDLEIKLAGIRIRDYEPNEIDASAASHLPPPS